MRAAVSPEEHFTVSGDGDTFVLIPGMEGTRHFWRFQVEEFAGRYRVIAFDLARRPPRLSSRLSHYAAPVLESLDRLGIDDAVIIGESMGGMVALEIALENPGRARGLILCNSMARPGRGGFGLNMFTAATLAHQLALLPFLSMDARRRLLCWVGRHRGFVLDPSPGNNNLVEYLMEYGRHCGPGGYLDRVIAVARADYRDRLGEIGVPVLVIRGAEDRLVGPEAAVELAGRIRGAELALVDGGGHCCPHTVPGETNRVILDWLERHGL